jgi:hypothetical protein
MRSSNPILVATIAWLLAIAPARPVSAQPLGTYRWQLQPFCNVLTLAITQNGSVYRIEGTDDQCGSGADQASAIGTGFQNPDGTIGFGVNIVVAPGGTPVHVDAALALPSLSGTWRDSAGNVGTFAFTPGAASGGTARPLPSPVVPAAIQLRQDGGLLATGQPGVGAIPATGPGLRMMWHPAKAAFRAGQVGGAQWDDPNVGVNSTALGLNTIASGSESFAAGGGAQATGIGSVAVGFLSRATGFASTAMGHRTTASKDASTAMGFLTSASGDASTAMGQLTSASGRFSTAMGTETTASGHAATAMGLGAVASGVASLAAGTTASAGGIASVALGASVSASTNGTFMFGDTSTSVPMLTFIPDQFLVRAAGGVGFYSNSTLTAGVTLAAGAGGWLSVSDVNRKQHFRDLSGEDVLAKLARMSIQEWSYKAQDASIRHVGPTAQEFHVAFGLGEDPLRIGTIDADGIALRAIQALEARDRQTAVAQASDVETIRQAMRALRAELADLHALVATLGGERR